MTPYILVMILTVAIAHFGRISNDTVTRRFSIGAVTFALVAFAGLRSVRVGTDTGAYKYFFTRSQIPGALDGVESGFRVLLWGIRSWTDSFPAVLLATALIVIGLYIVTILRTTPRYETAIFVYLTLGTFTFFFNGARQGIAAAICFAALPFVLQRRPFAYLSVIALASLFHQTAWIAAIIYIVASPRVGFARLALLAGATILTVAFLQIFVNFAADLLDDKYVVYAEAGEGGGVVWVAFLVCQGVALYMFRNVVRPSREYYDRLLNIYLFGLVPALASTISGVNPSGVLRLHIYFSSVSILLWPVVFYYLNHSPNRFIISLGFLSVAFLFFVLSTSSFSDLTPYSLTSELEF